jgi:hypothetical protein
LYLKAAPYAVLLQLVLSAVAKIKLLLRPQLTADKTNALLLIKVQKSTEIGKIYIS